MKLSDLEKVNDLVSHREECNKQIKLLQQGQIKICLKEGYHLDKIPVELLRADEPVRIILLNGLTKALDSIERELEELGVCGG